MTFMIIMKIVLFLFIESSKRGALRVSSFVWSTTPWTFFCWTSLPLNFRNSNSHVSINWLILKTYTLFWWIYMNILYQVFQLLTTILFESLLRLLSSSYSSSKRTINCSRVSLISHFYRMQNLLSMFRMIHDLITLNNINTCPCS